MKHLKSLVTKRSSCWLYHCFDRQETTATDPTKSATQAVSENIKFQFYQLLIWVKL